METIVADLANQQAELSELLTGLDDAGWARPSPCEGWTVADVVLHLAQTNELAVASARGRFDEGLVELTAGLAFTDSIDDGADLMVARDRGAPAPLVADRWRASADALDDALRQCDPSQRLMWVAGDLSARTLASTRLAETWIHTGDVASGLGRSIVPTDRLWAVARLAWRTLPYAFARAGRSPTGGIAFELQAPSGADWEFRGDAPAPTTIRGDAVELCMVAARRVDPVTTGLRGEGPDGDAVLELVRTWA
jgi:uncharacterized protein (TIGR03084 family)